MTDLEGKNNLSKLYAVAHSMLSDFRLMKTEIKDKDKDLVNDEDLVKENDSP